LTSVPWKSAPRPISWSSIREALAAWDCNDTRHYIYRDLFEHHQMVNRPEGIVREVMIRGDIVWEGGDFAGSLGRESLGRALRAA
jgi:hypothetical protein